MAVGKIIAGVAGVAGMGLVGVGYSGLAGQDDTTRDTAGEVVEGGQLGAFRIRVGDCLGDLQGSTFEAVAAVPCSQSHKYEVYAAFMIPGDGSAAFPGEASIDAAADDGCFNRFAGFVGLAFEQSIYGVFTIQPTRGSWDEVDDREVLCAIYNYDETLKQGTARDTRR
jgi:hypothetical protein